MTSIQPRWSHASTLINTTIYITGGTTWDSLSTILILDETLALDLTQPWTIDKPTFRTLAPLSTPLSGHSMNTLPGTSQLLVAGGQSTNTSLTPLANTPILLLETNQNGASWSSILSPAFNTSATTSSPTTNGTTTTSPTTGSPLFHRLYHASITTGNDGILLQGGYLSTVANGTVVSSLITLKPSNANNTTLTVIAPQSTAPVSLATNAPALARHTMTLTPDGRAIILGGINSHGILSNLSYAYVLDTQATGTVASPPQWKLVTLQGKPPDPRVDFSAVMVNTTTMLVYGGTSDFKSAFWVAFYLDLPTWTWTTPMAQGVVPRRWGHTATMVGSIMVVAFGLTSHQTPDNTTVVLLDTTTNTWITQFRPQALTTVTNIPNMDGGDNNRSSGTGGPLSLGAVLGLALLVTAAIVGGAFCLLIRRKKRRTRNTMARENLDQYTTSRAAASSEDYRSRGFFGRMATLLGVAGAMSGSGSGSGRGHGRDRGSGRGDGAHKRPDSKRYSEFSLNSHSSHSPISIVDRMAELGYSPVSLGYPYTVVQLGTGAVPVSSFVYPNQACAQTKRFRSDGEETQIVFHDLTLAQKEALRLTMEQDAQTQKDLRPKNELLQFYDDD